MAGYTSTRKCEEQVLFFLNDVFASTEQFFNFCKNSIGSQLFSFVVNPSAMKFCLALSLIASGLAFAPTPAFVRTSTELFTTRDTSKEVQEALEISKKFGETSPEARAAWDIVEELDASNRYGRHSDFMIRVVFCQCSFVLLLFTLSLIRRIHL
jgi:hypothetical protein